jgi:hypothetical protein
MSWAEVQVLKNEIKKNGGTFPSIMLIDSNGDMAGKTITIKDENGLFTHTYTFPNDGTTYLKCDVDYLAKWYISYSSGSISKLLFANVDSIGGILPNAFQPVSWANGSDSEISTMVSFADSGMINLSDYWSINDERVVSVSDIAATGTYDGISWSVGETHAAQNITLVLMEKDLYDLVTPTAGGRTKCNFVYGMKDCFNETGYMNSSNTNAGSWNSCARRNWCNGGFRGALPEAIRNISKQFKCPTINEYNGSTIVYSNDYFAFHAEKEIFGSATYSNTTEANALTHLTYYKTAANRIKKVNGSANYWWERSPGSSYTAYFCNVYSDGSASLNSASNSYGVAVCGCI